MRIRIAYRIRGVYTHSGPRESDRMKIGMVSLGCPKNLVDSEVMLGLAQQQGHELTRHAADADVLVVNTCAFIDRAKQESIDAILEMAEHKKNGACRKLIVTGCMAERYRDELRAEIPEIDAVLGTGEVPQIVDAIGGAGSAAPLDHARGALSKVEGRNLPYFSPGAPGVCCEPRNSFRPSGSVTSRPLARREPSRA